MASYQAMRWLDANDKTATICHDYEGYCPLGQGRMAGEEQYRKALCGGGEALTSSE